MAKKSKQFRNTKHWKRNMVFALCAWFVVLSSVPESAYAGPAIGAAVSAAFAKLTVASVLTSIIKSLIAGAILGGLGAMLSKKPKAPSAPDTSRTQMIKEPVTPRQYIFGRARVSGALTFLNTYANNKRAELCITLSGHPIDGVETVYFDDQELTLDNTGNVIKAIDNAGKSIDTWVNSARVKIGLGTATSDTDLLGYAQGQTAGDWTANHRQTGCAKLWITLNLNNKPGGGTVPNVSAIVRGMPAYDPRSNLAVWTTNPALLINQYMSEVGILEDDTQNADVDIAALITAANICDEEVDSLAQAYTASRVWYQADSSVEAPVQGYGSYGGFSGKPAVTFASPHPFVTGDRISMIAQLGPYINGVPSGTRPVFFYNTGRVDYGYVKVINTTTILVYMSSDQSKWATGPGSIFGQPPLNWANMYSTGTLRFTRTIDYEFHNAITLNNAPVKLRQGDKVRLSSTGTLPGGLSNAVPYYVFFMDNSGNVIGLATTKLNADRRVPVLISTSGTGTLTITKSSEPRYTLNGRLSSDTQPIDALPDLLSSMVGTLVYVGGKWKMIAGAYTTPVLTFDESDLDGKPRTQTRIPLRDKFNSVKGTFFSPAAFYESTSFPSVKNSYYITQDGNQSWHTVSLPFTNSPGMCQRIAKCLLEAVRQQISTQWPMKLTALKCQVGDIVMLNRPRLGWNNKPFQVMDWQLVTRGRGSELRLGVDVAFREVSPEMFSWNNGEETDIDPAPNSTLPSAFVISAPGQPDVMEQEVLTNDSQTVKSIVKVSWAATPTDNALNYVVRYKLSSSSAWTTLPAVAANAFDTIIYGLDAGVYDFQVKAVTSLGVSSEYSSRMGVEIMAMLVPPDPIVGLTMQEVSSLGILRWNIPEQLSVRINGQIRIRHTEEPIHLASLANSVEIVPAVPGNANHAVVPLKPGTYLVHTQNASGVLSLVGTKITAEGATVLTFSPVDMVQEHPFFPGTGTNIYYDPDTSTLSLAAAELVDDMPDWDGIPSFDFTGGAVASGTYNFAAGIDLGSVKRVRLNTTLQTLLVNVQDSFDLRTELIDAWPDFDGIEPGVVGDARIEVRTTNDDPLSPSPNWSVWNWLVTADYRCRALQFRLQMSVNDTAYNIFCTALAVEAVEL